MSEPGNVTVAVAGVAAAEAGSNIAPDDNREEED
jgi:hypothetical protein